MRMPLPRRAILATAAGWAIFFLAGSRAASAQAPGPDGGAASVAADGGAPGNDVVEPVTDAGAGVADAAAPPAPAAPAPPAPPASEPTAPASSGSEPTAAAPADGESALSAVVVTGTRRAQRTVFDSNVPVDVISGDSLKEVSTPDLNDRLQAAVPSFDVARLPLSDGAIFNRPATLRGLSPDETLVLINGKRRHRSAYIDVTSQGAQAVDLSEIPLSAIDRIEVLRDGASAQYGSDAIAGVINIILKDKPGFEGYTQAGQYYAGDGANYLIGANQGFALGDRGSFNLSLEGNIADATSRSNQRPNAAALLAAGNTAVEQPAVQRFGQPDTKSLLAFVNAKYRFSDVAEAYAFGNFGYKWGQNDFNYRNPTQGGVFTSSQAAGALATNLATLPAPYQNWYNNNPAVLSGYPGGFTPKFAATSIDVSAVGGVRGNLAPKLDWDLSGRFGRNWIQYNISNTINASEGPYSPTSFKDGTKTQTEYGANLDFNYLWSAGLAEPVNVAFGAEARREDYSAGLGDPNSYAIGPLAAIGLAGGSNGFFGTDPTQAGEWGRNSYAGYVDLDVDVTKAINLGGAVRAEDYSDAGGTVNGKFATRIAVAKNFNIRGAVSTGFRAPTPGQEHLTNTNQFPSPDGSIIETNGTIPPTNPIAKAVGGQPLKPEKSTNLSLGFVTELLKKLTFSADAYLIYVRDRIGLSQQYSLTPDQQTALVNSGIAAAQGLTSFNFFVNGYDTRTAGADFVLAYTYDISPAARLIFTGAANLNRTNVIYSQPGVIGAYQRLYIEQRLPKYSENLSVETQVYKLSVLTRARNYGSWTEPPSDQSTDAHGNLLYVQEFGERCFFDLAASYEVSPGITLTLGAENLFNTYTDKAKYPNTLLGAATGQPPTNGRIYPSIRPYPDDGGSYYARLSGKF